MTLDDCELAMIQSLTGVKDTHRNFWKDISFELPFFFSILFVGLWGEVKEMYFWEDKWVGDRLQSSSFPQLYHLASFNFRLGRQNVHVSRLNLWRAFLVSLSLGFCWISLLLTMWSLLFYGGLRFQSKLCRYLTSFA